VKVRGISILARKAIITRRFGMEAWKSLYGDVARAHHCFQSFITAESVVPLTAYLAFHDELMRRFFKLDEASYTEIGHEASRWALTEGPLKAFLERQDFTRFVPSLARFHRLYFDDTGSWSEASLTKEGVDFKVFDLPEWHPYLEHFIVGYIAEVIEMFCANPISAVRLSGGAGRTYHYSFRSAPVPRRVSSWAAGERERERDELAEGSAAEGAPRLSSREIEVLTLIAQGKTNDEIGNLLGISGKTAQHHVARVYRKIGVSSRVGATLWLAERGFVNKLH